MKKIRSLFMSVTMTVILFMVTLAAGGNAMAGQGNEPVPDAIVTGIWTGEITDGQVQPFINSAAFFNLTLPYGFNDGWTETPTRTGMNVRVDKLNLDSINTQYTEWTDKLAALFVNNCTMSYRFTGSANDSIRIIIQGKIADDDSLIFNCDTVRTSTDTSASISGSTSIKTYNISLTSYAGNHRLRIELIAVGGAAPNAAGDDLKIGFSSNYNWIPPNTRQVFVSPWK